MEQHLTDFKVENFKKFPVLEISNMGQFNLIVGDNNTGKTSAIEAMVFDDYLPNYLSSIYSLLKWRKLQNVNQIDFNYFNLFFHNRQLKSINYSVKYKGEKKLKKFSYEVEDISDLSENEQQFSK